MATESESPIIRPRPRLRASFGHGPAHSEHLFLIKVARGNEHTLFNQLVTGTADRDGKRD